MLCPISALVVTAVAWEPCRLEAQPYLPTARAECGAVSVPVDPERPEGPAIDLFVAKVRSSKETPAPDPLVLISGGPGQSTESLFVTQRAAFGPALLERDIIVVDQRGTGRSARMDCPEQEEAELDALSDREVEASVRACLDQLPHDPRYFTTSVAVDDLDRVRAALGVARWNLYGVSYGTRVALHYAHAYPDRARSLVLDGVAGRERVLGPDIALRSQETVEAIFERCRADPGCADAVGDPAAHLEAVVARLASGPVSTVVLDARTGRPRSVELDLDAFRGVIRMFAYRPETQALIPVLLHEAAVHENYGPLAAQAQQLTEELATTFAFGMHNAVVCSEDAPLFERTPELEAALDATYLGAGLMRFMETACRSWPKGVVDDDLRAPLRGGPPMLLLSGELDPITPPRDAEALADDLDHATHLVVPGQGHGVAGVGCVPRLIADFLEDPLAPLAAACVQRAGPFPFAVDANGPKP